jgi:hypothetical protein
MIGFPALGQRGRLGNQLFQIAATIGIARDRGDDFIFPPNWLYRPYFSFPDEFFGEFTPDMTVATELAPHLDPRCRDYLQDITLFVHHLPEIREYLTGSDLAWTHMDQAPNSCSHSHTVVHVRRGDNVYDPGVPNKADYHPVPPTQYYLRGIEHFNNPHLWVYSDDIDWCKENLPHACQYGHGVAYAKEHEPEYGNYPPTDWMDLLAMSNGGSAYVVTGSTFGVWGALLANVPPDNVVRPDKVYGSALPWINESTLFHPQWEILECFSTLQN